MSMSLALALVLVIVGGCDVPWKSLPAPKVAPASVVSRTPLARTFKLEPTVGPPRGCPIRDDGELEGDFNSTWQLGRTCFDGFAARLDDGVRDMLRGLLTENQAAPMYDARLRATFSSESSHLARGETYHFIVHWIFEMLDKTGAVVVRLDQKTPTERVDYVSDETIEAHLGAAEARILDAIRTAVLASSAMQP